MVTLTLQDIIGHEPFHWRGDRDGIEQFSATFTNLQAAATGITTNEMTEVKAPAPITQAGADIVRRRDEMRARRQRRGCELRRASA